MVKTYFDIEWTGPKVETDASGKILSTDKEIVSKSALHPSDIIFMHRQ